ncbi:MAG TPA: hypothetical protein DDZ80_23310 [Cyanobacteria bacterium UBA8803]|nr:hypothetical protein [Cyanobacteria bacterium UBA9273]HBL61254.1 hypothetical protein [Cyanobacteria bacterium UBA8803]
MTEPSIQVVNRLVEAIAANREVADLQIDALNTTVERTSSNVNRAIEAMQQTVCVPPIPQGKAGEISCSPQGWGVRGATRQI